MLSVLFALAALRFFVSDTSAPPVSKLELISGLVTFQYQRDLERFVRERGIDFVLDADFENTLNHAGANKELIAATRSTHSFHPGGDSVAEGQAIVYLSKCAGLEHGGQTGGVAEECEPALKLLPNNVYVLTAVSYAMAHDFHSVEALPYIQQAVRLAPESSEVHRVYADVRLHPDGKEEDESEEKKDDKGENERRTEKYQEKFNVAVSEYLEAIRLDLDNTIAHYELGRTYSSDEPEKAVAEYEEVARLDPTSADALSKAGDILAGEDKLDEALVEFAKAEKADPNFSRAYQHRAEIFAEKKQYDDAIREAKKAIELDPKFMPSRLTLADAYLRKGEFEHSMRVLREAALSEPDNPAPTEYMVDALYDKGDLAGAISALREGIRTSPVKWSQPHAELAALLEESGEFGNALNEYQEVLKLSGDSPELQIAINRVKPKLPTMTR